MRCADERRREHLGHPMACKGGSNALSKRWLVIFSEGEVCWQNDTVMPFQQGMGTWIFAYLLWRS